VRKYRSTGVPEWEDTSGLVCLSTSLLRHFVTSLLLQHFFHQFALQAEHVGGGDAGFEDLADEGVRGRGRVVDEDDEVAVGAAGELEFFGGVVGRDFEHAGGGG